MPVIGQQSGCIPAMTISPAMNGKLSLMILVMLQMMKAVFILDGAMKLLLKGPIHTPAGILTTSSFGVER